jgi:hypothetical protein
MTVGSGLPRLAVVEWEDAHDQDGGVAWVDNPGKEEPWAAYIVISVGFVLYDGPEGMRLTSAWSKDVIGHRDNIPRGMIRKVSWLNPRKARP